MDRDDIAFGNFRLDLRSGQLLREGQPVAVARRSLGLLRALAEANGRVVTKDELMARLWPGRVVEEGNIHVHVSALRKALDDEGNGHSYVVTVPGRGYRLAAIAPHTHREPELEAAPPSLSGNILIDSNPTFARFPAVSTPGSCHRPP